VQLDERQAFQAMTIFLEEFWKSFGGQAPIGQVLNEIEIEPDGRTHDPAAWEEWIRIVRGVIGRDENAPLTRE
jgi:hypothetical protein